MEEFNNLEKSEARFRTIYENAPFMIDSFDEHGKAVLWNNACCKQLGYSIEEINSHPDPLSLFYPEQQVRDHVLKTIQQADGKFREFKVRHKDGRFLYQMWANFMLPDRSVIAVGYDISEARANKEELSRINHTLEEKVQERTIELDQQRAKLVFASKYVALGEMAAGVAHEINNPLAIIAGYSEQLRGMLSESAFDKKNFEDILLSIRSAVDRITRIVSGLRSISRDGSGDPMVSCQVNLIIQEVLGFCRERFQSFGVDLILEGDLLFGCVEARPVQISQVLLNLLNNAFDAVGEAKKKWVKVSVQENTEFLRIAISDSGAGISPVVKEKIFLPFFTTKPLGKGTGLGLSISKSIIEAHGGSLSLEEDTPHTTFVVTLPLCSLSTRLKMNPT